MNCLIDFVPIRTCETTTSPSGRFINELPGIELRMIDKLADEEQADFNGVFDDVQNRAATRLKNDVIAAFANKYRLKQIYKSIDIGRKVDSATVIAAGTNYRGAMIELNDEGMQYVHSNLMSIYVDKIRVYLDGEKETTIKVYDLDTEEELYTQTFTGVQGWNDKNILQSFTARRISVVADFTNSESVLLDINSINNYPFSDWFDGCCTLSFDNSTVGRVTGITSTIADKFNLTESQNTHGVSVVFSVKCAYDNIICNNKELFIAPWMYLLGSELMSERLYTSRLNEYTSIKRDDATRLKQMFEAQYRGGVVDEINYPGELNQAIYSIELSDKDACIECDAKIRFIESVS